MKTSTSSSVPRLLRAAASVPNEPAPEMPFGFDTRVVALWRASLPSDPAEIGRLLRRVMLVAASLIVLATAGAYRELHDGDEAAEPFGNEFSIADTAISGVFGQ